MKKILLGLALVLGASASAQVIYLEDFDNVPGPTAGGAGTYAFPANMLKRNVDNLTPNTNVAYVNEAWERREDFITAVGDSCAFSTSWYTPAGTSNDWMWTPLVGTIAGPAQLTWRAKAPDAGYPDGYEVRIMTATQGPPTGGAGAIGNQITNSTLAFSVAAENSTWTTRTVDLAPYIGQSIYVGFRNTSVDMFLLMVDDIQVEILATSNAAAINTNVPEYSLIPVSQASAIGTGGSVSNVGSGTITNVNMTVNVYDGAMGLVYTANSTAIPTMAPAATAAFTVPGFTPVLPDLYTVEMVATLAEVDLTPANNTVSYTVLITDSTFARDNGSVTGTLGIGAGNGGQLGQAFTLNNADDITSVSIFIGNGTGNMNGQPLTGGVWATDGTGTPTTLLTSTVTVTLGTEVDSLWTLPIVGGTYNLAAGTYVVVVNEADSNVTVGTATNIFTPNTTWVNWPTNPNGAWSNNEDFGFNISYVIRPNFSNNCVTTSSSINETACDTYTWAENAQTYTTSGTYSVTLVNAGGCDSIVTLNLTIETLDLTVSQVDPTVTSNAVGAQYQYQWIDCATGTAIAGATNQSYTATVTGDYAVVVTSGTCGPDTSACTTVTVIGLDELDLSEMVEVYPNPSTGEFTVALAGMQNEDLLIEVCDLNGKVIAREQRAHASGDVTVAMKVNAEPGVYMVKVSAGNKNTSERLVITRK